MPVDEFPAGQDDALSEGELSAPTAVGRRVERDRRLTSKHPVARRRLRGEFLQDVSVRQDEIVSDDKTGSRVTIVQVDAAYRGTDPGDGRLKLLNGRLPLP